MASSDPPFRAQTGFGSGPVDRGASEPPAASAAVAASPGGQLTGRPEPEQLVDVPLDGEKLTFSSRNELFQAELPPLVVEAANPLAAHDFTGSFPCMTLNM